MPVSSTTGTRRSTPASPWRRCLMGTSRLYPFAERNPAIKIRATSYTHDALVLGNFRRFIAINGALEVDLTGQVTPRPHGEDISALSAAKWILYVPPTAPRRGTLPHVRGECNRGHRDCRLAGL